MTDVTQKSLILGLGMTGVACARLLQQRGTAFAIADSREAVSNLAELQAEFVGIDIHMGAFTDELLHNVNEIVISPGIDRRIPFVQAALAKGISVVGDIELFIRAIDVPVIAVTGSNGKSTAVTLLGEMAKVAGLNPIVAGNIGVAVADVIRQREAAKDAQNDESKKNTSHEDTKLCILELSSFQLESTVSMRAISAVVLNVSEDHMDRYEGLDDYAATKAVVYQNADTCVVNLDDARVAAMAEGKTFSINQSADYCLAGDTLVADGEPVLSIAELGLAGKHNVANVLACFALGDAAGIPRDAMLRAAKEFKGLDHRMQTVHQAAGVRWINDSKATNVGATLAAINGLDDPIVLIAGGDGKGAVFTDLRDAVRAKVKSAFLIGKDARALQTALHDCTEVHVKGDLEAAVQGAAMVAVSGDVVLLSPACASLDMFKSFEARGEQFAAAARKVEVAA